MFFSTKRTYLKKELIRNGGSQKAILNIRVETTVIKTIMKKKFFLNKTVDALSEKQIEDLDKIFGGVAAAAAGAVGLPWDDDIIHIPTGGGGPRCPDGFYWHERYGCLREGELPHEPIEVSHGRREG